MSKPLTFGSLFSGIGGFDLAAQRAGVVPAWACEIDQQCRSVLRRRFPDVIIYNDARSLTYNRLHSLPNSEDAGAILSTEDREVRSPLLVQNVLQRKARSSKKKANSARATIQKPVGKIRHDKLRPGSDVDKSGRSLCDLQECNGSSANRPLPQDRGGSRTSLPPVQHQVGGSGRHPVPASSDELSGGLQPVDIVLAGFPCQDLSVAGKRAGLDGARSGLFFEITRLISEMREATDGRYPAFAVLENVPGLLSSNGGRDFAVVLGELAKAGAMDIAWSILDAQWFGVPQRRKRVFIVVDFRGRRAAEVLFERECLPWDSPPRRKTGPRTSASVAKCLNSGGNAGGFRTEPGEHLIAHTLRAEGHDASEDGTGRGVPLIAHALTATATATGRLDPNGETFIPCGPLQAHSREHGHAMTTQQAAESGHLIAGYLSPQVCRNSDSANEVGIKTGDLHDCLQSDGPGAVAYQCHGSNVGPMGTLKGEDLTAGVPFVFDERNVTSGENRSRAEPGLPSHTLHSDPPRLAYSIQYRPSRSSSPSGPQGKGYQEGIAYTLEARHHSQAVAFQAKYFSDRDGQGGQPSPLAPTLTSANAEGSDGEISVAMTGDIKPAGTMEFMRRSAGVRRLTPRECERLQGFPDDWTRYADNGREISDSARYRMLGNAVAIPVVEWIMRRIAERRLTQEANP